MLSLRVAGKCAAIVLGLVLSLSARADTFRCDGHIIEEGMSQDEVLKHCGQPDEMNNQVHITWTYKQPEGRMDIVIYFYANGNIEQIRSMHN
jgi:hypothetical protein